MKEINNNIKEVYCSPDVSKLLKEKGFDVFCSNGYNIKTGESISSINSKNSQGLVISAPTTSVAIEWIRINFDIHITALRSYTDSNNTYFYEVLYPKGKIRKLHQSHDYKNPQEAIEAAFLYVLNNLI